MGSDTPPEILFPALLQLAQENPSSHFVIFVTQDAALKKSRLLETVLSSEVITMEDEPLSAIRHKKESSLLQGLEQLRGKKIDAFVSAGNTGALLLGAKTTLEMIPGIERPALLTLLPTKEKEMAVLDVGANLTLKPKHILQLAAMGIAYQKTRGIAHPTVGLLNIGTEAKKGTPHHREAYQKLQSLNENQSTFLGNIEGRQAFEGSVDVLVTDGFSGNIFLKAVEGIASFVYETLEQHCLQEEAPKFKEKLGRLRRQLHPEEYPGAILCGVDGIVVKCHGDSSPEAFKNGVNGALQLVKNNFLEKIKQQITI